MKTSTTAPRRPSTASGLRLPRLAVVGLLAPVVALSACSGDPAVTADPTAPTGTATTPVTTTATTTDATTTSSTPTTVAAPAPMSYRTVKAVIKDPDLGHTITATRLARNMSWPTGNPVGSEQFEIVGVRVTFDAGSRYSASLEPGMLSLVTADPKQTVQPTTEFSNLWKAAPLKTATRDKSTSGWVFFKVDRGTTSALTLAYNRPAYQVSTTDKNIKAKTFTVVLTK